MLDGHLTGGNLAGDGGRCGVEHGQAGGSHRFVLGDDRIFERVEHAGDVLGLLHGVAGRSGRVVQVNVNALGGAECDALAEVLGAVEVLAHRHERVAVLVLVHAADGLSVTLDELEPFARVPKAELICPDQSTEGVGEDLGLVGFLLGNEWLVGCGGGC